YDRNSQRLCQCHSCFDIKAVEHAIATDISVNDSFHTIILKFSGQIYYIVAGNLGPAIDCNFSAPGIESDHNLAGKCITGIMQKSGYLDGSRANDDIADTVVQIIFYGF